MGNLLTSLLNTTNALGVYSQALNVIQNNVTNASTPGYVKQSLSLEAQPFDVTVGLPGGVMAAGIQSSRDAFAENSVRQQQSALGASQQEASSLASLQTYFDLQSGSAISSSLDSFFATFSQLSVRPNDTLTRQTVINAASQVAQSFQQTANGLATQMNNLNRATGDTVDNINRLAGVIAKINSQGRITTSRNIDAGVDAQLNASLEELSQYASFNALQQPDGSISVYLNGQTPLVVGSQVYDISADFSNPQTHILDSTGKDITSQTTGGQLSGLLDVKNSKIPSYMSDLNTLAQSFAAQVNTALGNGVDENGATPTQNLFTYDPSTGAAQTLAVTPITPDQLAAALPDAPGGNGNALQLSALGKQNSVNGYTFTGFYGKIASRLGQDVSDFQDQQSTDQDLLTQAQTLRSQTSGVSLDEEAAKLIQFQRAYEASAKLLQVLDEITSKVMDIIQ